MPDIRTLVSSQIHEPKYISDSTSADAGKVITPLSNGTSELRFLTPEEVGVYISYGEMDVDNNANAFAVTAATDQTFQTASDYLKLNSAVLTTAAGESYGVTHDAVNNTLVLSTSGVYRIGGWVNASSSTANSKIGIKYTRNGTVAGGKLVTDIKDTDRAQNLSGFGLVTLSAGDAIGVAFVCDKSANITISDMRINLELIRAI